MSTDSMPAAAAKHSDAGSVWSDARTLFAMAVPIAASQFLYIVNAVVDSVMAGHLGVVPLAAISAGVAFWAPASMVLAGFLYLLTPIVAHHIGAKTEEETGPALAQGLAIGLGGGSLMGLTLWFGAEPVFVGFGVAPEIVPDAVAYVQWVALGFPGCGVFVALRFLIEGFGFPKLVTIVAIFSAVANATLNYGFMYGGFGLPALGAPGCGVATAINFTLIGLIMTGLSLRHPRIRVAWTHLVASPRLQLMEAVRFLRSSSWIAFNLLSDYLVMTVVGLAIAAISAVAAGAHQIAFNVLTAVLVVPIGVSMAATVLVAKAAGARDRNAALRHIGLSLGASVAVCSLIALVLALLPERIALQYTDDSEVIAQAVALLYIALLILPIDAAVISACFLLRGLGDMAGPFFITFIAHWGISLPAGYVLSSTALIGAPLGAVGWWYGLGIGLVVGVLLAALRMQTIYARALKGPSG